MRVLFYAVPPVIAFIFRQKLEPYYEKNPIIPICVNMSLITAALYLVGVFTSGILIGRLPIYCEVYNLILIPYLLHCCFDKVTGRTVRIVYTVVLLVFFYLQQPTYYHSDLTGVIK